VGQEAQCRVTVRRDGTETTATGKALLETSELIFRGEPRLRIALAHASEVRADGGVLTLVWPEGEAAFELGPNAAKWAARILNPRGLLDKLGLKPGAAVSVIGMQDDGFIDQVKGRAGRLVLGRAEPGSDFVFYAADDVAALAALPTLRAAIKPAGAVWVVSPKGKGAAVRDVDVMAAAKEAGLVDVKVVGFSETHTALKLVVPVAMRPKS
jgi:hypothetical protein